MIAVHFRLHRDIIKFHRNFIKTLNTIYLQIVSTEIIRFHMKYVSNNLQQVLNDEGLTQADLHRISEVNSTTINKICTSKNTSPTDAIITRLVKGVNKLIEKDKYKNGDIFTVGSK